LNDQRRIASLDALRALAVLLVIGHHAAWRFRPDPADPLAQVFRSSGWIGVDIFFAISGFMITSILLRDRGDIRGFFVRRFYRIVPIFLVAIACFGAISIATGMNADKLRLLWSPALLLNGWTIPWLGYGAVPYMITWSLSVEETAYLILGLSSLAGPRGIRMALLAFVVGAPLVRVAVLVLHPFSLSDLYFFVPARLDAIAYGGLAGFGYYGKWPAKPWMRAASGAAMAILIVLFEAVPVGSPLMVLLGYPVFCLVAAMFVASFAAAGDASAPARGWAGRAARRVGGSVVAFGRVSYFIYLFHLFVLEALLYLQRRNPQLVLGFWQALPIATVVAFALALLSWRVFEQPLIRYGRRVAQSLLARPLFGLGARHESRAGNGR